MEERKKHLLAIIKIWNDCKGSARSYYQRHFSSLNDIINIF